jgi:hypothetical protein
MPSLTFTARARGAVSVAAGLALTTALSVVPGTARAQGNDLSAPTGGRTALMGNTGVALARDGAAPFLNPATIVRIQDERLAFSVNFYSLGLTHLSNLHQPGSVDSTRFGDGTSGSTSVTENSFRVLPSTLCLFFTIGDIERLVDASAPVDSPDRARRKKLAICFASLESVDTSLTAESFLGTTTAGRTHQVESLTNRWSRTYVGPTYSTYLTRDIAIGGSLHGVYTYDSFGASGSSISAVTGGNALASNLSTSGSGHSLDLTALVGATYHHEHMTYGLSVRAPSLHVLGSYSGTFNESDTGATTDATVTSGTGSFRAAPPMRVAAGVGGEWSKVRAEVDLGVDIPTSNVVTASIDTVTSTLNGTAITASSGHQTATASQQVAISPSIGLEYLVRPTFGLIGGLSANLSSIPGLHGEPSLGNVVQARTNQVNAAFGFGSYSGASELLVGLQGGFGWGQSVVVNPYVVPNDFSVVDTQTYSLMLVIAGATDLRTIVRAVERVRNAVQTGDPEKAEPKKP